MMGQVEVLNCHSYRNGVKRLASGGQSATQEGAACVDVCVCVCFKLIPIKLSPY